MGTWGYNIYGNDTFCEVIELFKERIRCGQSVDDISKAIQHEYEDEIDASIASLAVAECLWRLGKLTSDDLNNVKHIIEEGTDIDYWIQLGADEEFIHKRKLELSSFLNRISTPPTEDQLWCVMQEENLLQKGSCFWYRCRGNSYGAIVLETIKNTTNYYLILVSERMNTVPKTISHILSTPVYTAAWFGEANLLNSKRTHIIGNTNISRNYKNKYGIKIESGKSAYITNCGQNRTWGHSFRQLSFDNMVMQDFVS